MAANCVTVALRKNYRRALATTTFMTVCLVVSWQNDLFGESLRSLRPKRTALSKGNQSRTLRFVSLCSANIDRRRLGNQLFNWAAMLYVAQLAGTG